MGLPHWPGDSTMMLLPMLVDILIANTAYDPNNHPYYQNAQPQNRCFVSVLLAPTGQPLTPWHLASGHQEHDWIKQPKSCLFKVILILIWRKYTKGHQELSGKSDKNNSLKPNQTTPSEHCHFQRLRAKPNFLRLSRTYCDVNTRLNSNKCALIWRKPKSDVRICWLLQIYSHK